MTARMIEVKVVLQVWVDVPEDADEGQIDEALGNTDLTTYLTLDAYDRTDGWYDPESELSAEY